MPPKSQQQQNKKTEEKRKQKIVEDKTFGLKNKKGAKMQKYCAMIEKNLMGNKSKAGQPQQGQSKKKNTEDDDLLDLTKIFKPVQSMPKIAEDVDPKSVLCVFYKQGLCTKGNKCKFSHDLATQQKTAKRNLYVDSRDLKKNGGAGASGSADPDGDDNLIAGGGDGSTGSSENWDQQQLNAVAEQKHGAADRRRPNQTDIVCKYFIDAVENNKYGWFWECPNGSTCIYRHALPPGYVLKRDRKQLEEEQRRQMDETSLEQLIEEERASLSARGPTTKITLETFLAWKRRKMVEKRNKQAKLERTKLAAYRTGNKQQALSGRDLFLLDPSLVAEDEEGTGAENGGPPPTMVGTRSVPIDGRSESGMMEEGDNEGPLWEDDGICGPVFEIDEHTFCPVDAEGRRLELPPLAAGFVVDDGADEENDGRPRECQQQGHGGQSGTHMFDRALFDQPDGGIDEFLDDNEEEGDGAMDGKESSLDGKHCGTGDDDLVDVKVQKSDQAQCCGSSETSTTAKQKQGQDDEGNVKQHQKRKHPDPGPPPSFGTVGPTGHDPTAASALAQKISSQKLEDG